MDTAVAQALPALAELRRQGVIGAVGVGMNSVAPLMRFVIETDVDVVMVAGRWTLADRTALPLLTECADRGVSVVAAAPFNSGLLSDPDPSDGASFDYRSAPPDLLARARALAQVCRRQATVLPHAAIRFPLRHPAVASVVAGFRTPQEVRSAARWAERDLPSRAWEELEAAAIDPPESGTVYTGEGTSRQGRKHGE